MKAAAPLNRYKIDLNRYKIDLNRYKKIYGCLHYIFVLNIFVLNTILIASAQGIGSTFSCGPQCYSRLNRQIIPSPLYSGGTVHVGLIFNEQSTGSAVRFLQRTNEKLQREGFVKYYKYDIETNSNAGCGIALEDGDGAFAASELYYHKNVTAFFGPACGSDIEFISRMIWAWGALEFNFYRDFNLNTDTKTLPFVQISTMSAVNFALNLFAVLNVLGWQKVALITCSACFIDTKNDLFSGNTVSMRFEVIRSVLIERGITVLDRVDIAEVGYTTQQLADNLRPVKAKARSEF